MKRIGLHIWIRYRREAKKSPLIQDSIDKGYSIRLPHGSSDFDDGWSEPISECARRYMRMAKKDTYKDWNDICKILCGKWSGNPDQTMRAVGVTQSRSKPNRRLYLYGDPPKLLAPYIRDCGGFYRGDTGLSYAWERLDRKAKERLEIWRSIRSERERVNAPWCRWDSRDPRNFTCEKCGSFDDTRRKGFMGVHRRWDCSLPETRQFRDKKPKYPGISATNKDRLDFLEQLRKWEDKYRAPVLCVPCWNKHRVIFWKAHEISLLQRTINKTEREMKNGKQKHNQQHSGIVSECT